jgi:hypothetical protein
LGPVRSTFKAVHLLPLSALVLFSLQAGASCPHLDSERAALYQRSSFAHGYIHGYEQGFHIGNQDLQLARASRDLTKTETYRKAGEEYRPDFGKRDAFRIGYRNGMVVGYTDAMNGHSFRAIDEARIAAARLENEGVAPYGAAAQNHHFELGFMDGYTAGTLQGVGDGRNRANYQPAQADCGIGRGQTLGETYCTGYLRGFSFGYSDGYINHPNLIVTTKGAGHPMVTAAKK